MSLTRFTSWTVLVVAGFALFAPTASAQDPQRPKKPNTSLIVELYERPRGGIAPAEMAKARETFKAWAKFAADTVAYMEVYKAPQDLKVLPIGVEPPPTIDGPNGGLLYELNRFIIEPGVTRPQNLDPADYIREMGAALDAALKDLIETHPERIVRINAARVLANIARTGAPAHFPTVTTLIANANTPPEVKYYLFQAAGALLNAPDVSDLRIRRHAADAATIGKLVKALQDCIDKPEMIVPGVSASKPETLTEDQLAVVGFIRRHAVKALGHTKFVRVPGPDGKTPIYPAYTLVRVAMSDPNLLPPPGPAEAAEAVIGICNMAPTEEQLKGGFKLIKEYNSDVAVEAVTAALVTFAKPRAANAFDRSLPWRLYAARVGEALRNWRLLFDPDYESFRPINYNPALIPAGVEALSTEVVPKVLAPMDKVDFQGKPEPGATVGIEWLQQRVKALRERPKRNTELFANVAATTINFPPPKKVEPPVKEPEKKEPIKQEPKKEPEKAEPPKK
jgi:hypothetical protein